MVSGINPMPNLGHDVTYSGTVTAAMEALIWGIPGIAFSLGSVENGLAVSDYQPAANVAQEIVAAAIQQSLPSGTLLNVNVPMLAEEDQRVSNYTLRIACLPRSIGSPDGSSRRPYY